MFGSRFAAHTHSFGSSPKLEGKWELLTSFALKLESLVMVCFNDTPAVDGRHFVLTK